MNKVVGKIEPNKTVITLPGSKSISHRALIASFLANQKITLKNLNYCDDVEATLSILRDMGGFYTSLENNLLFAGREEVNKDHISINAFDSGSTLRMLLPLLVEMYGSVKVSCNEGLLSRPLDTYEEIFTKQGISITKNNGYEVEGRFSSYDFEIASTNSSQFISGLLFLLSYKKQGSIKLPESFGSSSYVDLTLNVLSSFGYLFLKQNNLISFVKQTSIETDFYQIDSDASSLPYWALIGAFNGEITINYSFSNLIQPDLRFLGFCKQIGLEAKDLQNSIIFSKITAKPFSIDISNCIDLGPVLMTLACLIDGTSTISGVDRLRIKESDRLNVMIKELSKTGVQISLSNDVVKITGPIRQYKPLEFETYNDHRIAMSLASLAACLPTPSLIKGIECVSKSYKGFFSTLDSLRTPKLTVSVYSFEELNIALKYADSVVLPSKFSYFPNKDFPLDEALEIVKKNNKEPVILFNSIILESELKEATSLLEKYKDYKLIVSDIGLATYALNQGFISSLIYQPDTLICNYKDLSFYQDFGFDATSLSSEITVKDVIASYNETKGNIFYQIFGRKLMFYSKRKHIEMFKEHRNISFENKDLSLSEEKRPEIRMPVIENENGFFVFRQYYLSLDKEIDSLSFLKYAFIESLTLSPSSLESILSLFKAYYSNSISKSSLISSLREIETNIEDGFSYSDTVYIKEKVH